MINRIRDIKFVVSDVQYKIKNEMKVKNWDCIVVNTYRGLRIAAQD